MAETLIREIINEAERIEEDAVHSGKSHFNASSLWSTVHYLLGIPMTVCAAWAWIDAFSDTPQYAGHLAMATTTFAALQTFINASSHASQHKLVESMKLKKPGSDEYDEKAVDLIESFNWLIGLHVDHLDKWCNYDGRFTREPDLELPGDDTTRLILDGRMKEAEDGNWLFRKVEGRMCRTPGDMNNTDRVLVIWRKLTGNLEEDNLMLDEWFKKYRLSTRDVEFDVIYVNGSNNLPNLCQDEEHWKVRLIEEAFHRQMWDAEQMS